MIEPQRTPAVAAAYPAGFVQRREWMLYKISHDHYPLNIGMDFTFGPFDPAAFQRVIDRMVQQHEILRTTLRVVDGSLRQIVHPPAEHPVPITCFDLRKKEPPAREVFIREKKLLQLKLPFNFEYGPLFRACAFRKGEEQWEVSLVFHHVIFDQQSGTVFKRDAFGIWEALSRGAEPYFPPDRVQYKSYAAFENQLLDEDAGGPHHRYWEEQLAAGLPRLAIIEADRWDRHYGNHRKKVEEVRRKIRSLPLCDERFVASVIRRYRPGAVGVVKYLYAEETFRCVDAFRQRSNSSLHALFIASFVVALHRLSGQAVFCFDIPAYRKVDAGYDHTIGWLAAGGVCFFDLDHYRDAGTFLTYIDRQLYLLSRHCIFPFEVVGHRSEVPPGSTMPVLFVLTETREDYAAAPGAGGVMLHEPEGETSSQDLDILLTVCNNACGAHIGYNHFLIPPQVIEQVLAVQETCLREIAREGMRSGTVRESGTPHLTTTHQA